MARLIIQQNDGPDRIVEMRGGPHRVGRSPENEIVLAHPSVSSQHCIVEIAEEGLWVRDLGSTNGTEVDGQPVLEALVQSGQVIQIGVFGCRVEALAPKVSIPKWEEPPPPQLPPGVKPCTNHPEFPASMECTHCHKVFCGVCVHLMRVVNGKVHKFCPICSRQCVPIDGMNAADAPGKLLGLFKKMLPKTGTMRLRRGRRRSR